MKEIIKKNFLTENKFEKVQFLKFFLLIDTYMKIVKIIFYILIDWKIFY